MSAKVGSQGWLKSRAFFGCQVCKDEQTLPASELAVFDGDIICEYCLNESFPEAGNFDDMPKLDAFLNVSLIEDFLVMYLSTVEQFDGSPLVSNSPTDSVLREKARRLLKYLN